MEVSEVMHGRRQRIESLIKNSEQELARLNARLLHLLGNLEEFNVERFNLNDEKLLSIARSVEQTIYDIRKSLPSCGEIFAVVG
jgi:hypothetical protein